MRYIILWPIAGALMLATATTQAATKQTTMGVSATVAANCIISAQNLPFGSFDDTVSKPGSADLTVRCSNGTPYTLLLSAGGGTYAQRLLSSGSNTLEYNLFTSSALTAVWGDGSGSTVTVGGTGAGLASGSAITHTVFGELPNSDHNKDAPPATYSDTITVTVSY